MHRSRISCRPMFGTTQRRRCDHDGAFQIGSTQESGWSVVSYDLGYIGLEAKTLLRRRSRLDSFCRETLEMGVFQGVRAYAEALEWLSWLRSGTDQEGKKCRGG